MSDGFVYRRQMPGLRITLIHPDGGPDGSVYSTVCRCIIPGKAETDWEGGYHPLTLRFSGDYPSKPPKCKISSRVLPS